MRLLDKRVVPALRDSVLAPGIFDGRGLNIAEPLNTLKRHIPSMASRALIFALVCTSVLRLSAAGTPGPEKDKMNLNGLVSNSPFGSAKSGVAAGNNGNEPFELRAVLEENNSKFFSIYDTNTHRSTWVEINDPVNGFSVKGYDAAKESITLDYQGKALTLAIKRAPAAVQVFQPPQPPSPQPGPNGIVQQPAAGQPGQVQPAGPSAVDQQRIQQIQEEIRRRRALRSQAVPSTGGTGVPQPTFNGGPQMQPSTSSGPVPQPSNSTGPQPYPNRTP